MLRTDASGICRDCRDALAREFERRQKGLADTEPLIEQAVTLEARLRAADLAIEHVKALADLVPHGFAVPGLVPIDHVKRLTTRREQLLLDALADAVEGAKGKAAAARTAQARRGALERGLERIEAIAKHLKRPDVAKRFERELSHEIQRIS